MFGDLNAAPPNLEHLFPVAIQAGTTNVITAIGKFDPWPASMWIDDPAIKIEASTNKGEFFVAAGETAVPGPHLVRLYNNEGTSRPRFLIVDREPQRREVEPNDELAAAELIHLPAVINGRLEKTGDVDSFAVTLAVGQTLVAEVEAYVLASPLDAVLRVIDARGYQRAWNHDWRTLDPYLAFTAPEAGRYVVQVFGFPYPATSEIRFYGNEKCVYRLHLNAGPYVRHTLPLGASRTGRTHLQFAGWNLPASMPRTTEFEASAAEKGANFGWLRPPGAENSCRIPFGEGAETIETEPNDRPVEAGEIVVPGAVTGRIDRADDEDRFWFTAHKGQRLVWRVQSTSMGFPNDTWIKIENTNGTQVARSEGGNGQDPEVNWTPGSDATFYAVVGSVIHRGGSNAWYRLSVTQPSPDFAVTTPEHGFVCKTGTTNEWKITVNRSEGYTNKITVTVAGQPTGVDVAPVDVPGKGGEVSLKAVVATNAPAFSGVIRFVAHAEVGTNQPAMERAAMFSFVSRSEDNGVPGGFRDLVIGSTDRLWLTIPPRAEKTEEKK